MRLCGYASVVVVLLFLLLPVLKHKVDTDAFLQDIFNGRLITCRRYDCLAQQGIDKSVDALCEATSEKAVEGWQRDGSEGYFIKLER